MLCQEALFKKNKKVIYIIDITDVGGFKSIYLIL